jgi:hypothetical protein
VAPGWPRLVESHGREDAQAERKEDLGTDDAVAGGDQRHLHEPDDEPRDADLCRRVPAPNAITLRRQRSVGVHLLSS